MVEHEDDDHIMRVATRLLDVVRENVIGPSDEIVGALVQCFHNWVLDDIIGEVDVKSISNKKRLISFRHQGGSEEKLTR